jgi:hypothetical protein
VYLSNLNFNSYPYFSDTIIVYKLTPFSFSVCFTQLGPTKKGMMSQWEEGDRRKGMIRYCEQCEQQQGCSSASSIASSSLPMGKGTWLALATSKASVEHKSKRG